MSSETAKTKKKIKSFDDLPEVFHVAFLSIGRGGQQISYSRKKKPSSFQQFLLIKKESYEQKVYEDGNGDVELDTDFDEREESIVQPATIDETISGYTDYFKNINITGLHYVHDERLKELYNDTFRSYVVRRLLFNVTDQYSHTADLNLINAARIAQDMSEVVHAMGEVVPQEISKQLMLQEYVRYAIDNNEITIGLDVLDRNFTNMNIIETRNREIQRISKRFTLMDSDIERERKNARQESVKDTINRMQIDSGWVLLRGHFCIERKNNDELSFIFEHPVSAYWGSPIYILVPGAKKDNFEDDYWDRYLDLVANNKGRLLHVFGSVFQSLNDRSVYNLTIVPVAIF